nr:MAG: hypothetical protein 3 [Leviviridae sp.]
MLIEAILREAGIDLDLSVERDVLEIRHRFEHEGLSFLTITLPTLSDSLERGIECGRFSCPTSFARRRHGRLPHFLGGFFNRVFDKDGVLLDKADTNAIYYIRQVCRFFKKMRLACTDDRNRSAEENFIKIEEELAHARSDILREDIVLDRVSGVIWSQVFPEIDPMALVPRHGPGATSDRLSPNKRYGLSYWYDRFEATFPSDLHAFANYGRAWEHSGLGSSDSKGLNFLSVSEELPVRVVFVPKTQTSPRVIAIEPSSMQYVQQALLAYTVEKLESCKLTKSSIRFSDQTVNQELARKASIDRTLATLDLKDASDRVSNDLVRRIFKTSGILPYLEDARSLHATLPSGKNIVLNKYASMGSAMCFPVEAMCFYTLIQSAMHKQDKRHPTTKSIIAYSKDIDIFGDDIIVPECYTDAVIYELESYSLRVNSNKSFRFSLFRESCGGDFYSGIPVKPVYARELLPERRCDWTPSMVISWTAKANEFYLAGLWQVSQCIREMVEWATGEKIPITSINRGSGLFFVSVFQTRNLRYNPRLCGWEQKRLVFSPRSVSDDTSFHPEANLNKWALTRASRFSHKEHSSCQIAPSLNRGSFSLSFALQVCGTASPLGGAGSEIHTMKVSRKMTSPTCDVLLRSNVLSTNLKVKRNGGPLMNLNLNYSAWFGVVGRYQVISGHLCALTQRKRLLTVRKVEMPSLAHSPSFRQLTESFTKRHSPDREVNLLDFESSVKRGDFKSKRRWITLIT